LIEGSEEGGIRLMATDLDLQINETVEAKVTDPGATTVPAHTLFEIVRKLPEGSQVELIAAEGRMQVNAGRARFTLATLPRDDFPIIAEGELPTRFELPATTSATDHRQDPLRHLDRGDALLSERHLSARLRRGAAGAEGGRHRRPPAGAGDRCRGRRAPRACPGVIIPRKCVGELRKLLDEVGRHGPGVAL
jgi:DNA polymerase-3 subunit beta